MTLPPHYEVSLSRIASQLRRLRKMQSMPISDLALSNLTKCSETSFIREFVILLNLLSQLESLTSDLDLTRNQRNEKLTEIGGRLLECSGLSNRDPSLQREIDEILKPFEQENLEELFQRLISLQKLRLQVLRYFGSVNQAADR